jgi:hypothetical protein
MTQKSIRDVFKSHGYHHTDSGILDPLIADIIKAAKGDLEMKKITEAQFCVMGWDERWDHIKALQTELETRGQGMGVDFLESEEKFTDRLYAAGWEDSADAQWDGAEKLRKELVNALTVPQGFVPDWSSKDIPNDATRLVVIARNGFNYIKDIAEWTRPLPPKVERARTRMEMIRALMQGGFVHSNIACHPDLKDSVLADLCTAAGISLTVLEEV